MLRAVLNLEQWPTDVLAREVQRLLNIAGLELAPIGAAAAVADALHACTVADAAVTDARTRIAVADMLEATPAPAAVAFVEFRSSAGDLLSRSIVDPAHTIGYTIPNDATHVTVSTDHKSAAALRARAAGDSQPPRRLRFEDGSTLTLAPDPRVEMDARTRRVSAGLEAPPAGVVTTFHAVPGAAMPRCPVCDHLEHGSAVCGTRVPLGWADAVDTRVPDTCQCDG
jgi:hypothetical protein